MKTTYVHVTDGDKSDNPNLGESSDLVRNQSFHQPNNDRTRGSFLIGNRVSLALEPQRTMVHAVQSVRAGPNVPTTNVTVIGTESTYQTVDVQHGIPEPFFTTPEWAQANEPCNC